MTCQTCIPVRAPFLLPIWGGCYTLVGNNSGDMPRLRSMSLTLGPPYEWHYGEFAQHPQHREIKAEVQICLDASDAILSCRTPYRGKEIGKQRFPARARRKLGSQISKSGAERYWGGGGVAIRE